MREYPVELGTMAENETDAKYPEFWKGLVGAWGASIDPSAYDLSGRGNNGTINADVSANVDSWSFVGSSSSQSIDVTSTSLLSVPSDGNFTVNFWARSSVYRASSAAISWGGLDDLLIYPYDNSSGNGCRVFWRDVGGSIINQNSGAVAVDTWNMFTFISRGVSDHECFVNVVSVGTSSASRSGAGPFSSGVWIGGWEEPQPYIGDLDCVTISNRDWSNSELSDFYGITSQNRTAWAARRDLPIPYAAAAAPGGGRIAPRLAGTGGLAGYGGLAGRGGGMAG